MKPVSVLLADDDAAFLEALTARLEMRDLVVNAVPSGEDALSRLAADPGIDVAVLDLKMPGLDGLQTLAVAKENHPLVEVIMLTGQGDVASGVACMKAGAFQFLEKPCDAEALTHLIHQAASQKRKHEDEATLIQSAPPLMRETLLKKASPPVGRLFGRPKG